MKANLNQDFKTYIASILLQDHKKLSDAQGEIGELPKALMYVERLQACIREWERHNKVEDPEDDQKYLGKPTLFEDDHGL